MLNKKTKMGVLVKQKKGDGIDYLSIGYLYQNSRVIMLIIKLVLEMNYNINAYFI